MQFECRHRVFDTVETFSEDAAPDWLTSKNTVPGSTMDDRWFWNEQALTLEVGCSVNTDFHTITRVANPHECIKPSDVDNILAPTPWASKRKMDSSLFGFSEWRNGSPLDFMVPCREESLVAAKETLRTHAVGWCRGESLACRPKANHKAIMFFKGGEHFWFHLSNREFERIFGDE